MTSGYKPKTQKQERQALKVKNLQFIAVYNCVGVEQPDL